MKRKTQTTPTPKKRRGKRKSTCSSYDRTEYFEDYYNKLKNDPKRLRKKREQNLEWSRTKRGKQYRKEYYMQITKQKRKIANVILQNIKNEQEKKALEYCPLKPGQCEELKLNEFNEKICHQFNGEIISLWDINCCPAKKDSK